MEKPTKAERHEVYKGALKEIRKPKNKNVYGLCAALSYWDGGSSFYPKYDAFLYMQQLFPEVYKHKPTKTQCFDFWFSIENGFQKRIDILKQAIKETKP